MRPNSDKKTPQKRFPFIFQQADLQHSSNPSIRQLVLEDWGLSQAEDPTLERLWKTINDVSSHSILDRGYVSYSRTYSDKETLCFEDFLSDFLKPQEVERLKQHPDYLQNFLTDVFKSGAKILHNGRLYSPSAVSADINLEVFHDDHGQLCCRVTASNLTFSIELADADMLEVAFPGKASALFQYEFSGAKLVSLATSNSILGEMLSSDAEVIIAQDSVEKAKWEESISLEPLLSLARNFKTFRQHFRNAQSMESATALEYDAHQKAVDPLSDAQIAERAQEYVRSNWRLDGVPRENVNREYNRKSPNEKISLVKQHVDLFVGNLSEKFPAYVKKHGAEQIKNWIFAHVHMPKFPYGRFNTKHLRMSMPTGVATPGIFLLGAAVDENVHVGFSESDGIYIEGSQSYLIKNHENEALDGELPILYQCRLTPHCDKHGKLLLDSEYDIQFRAATTLDADKKLQLSEFMQSLGFKQTEWRSGLEFMQSLSSEQIAFLSESAFMKALAWGEAISPFEQALTKNPLIGHQLVKTFNQQAQELLGASCPDTIPDLRFISSLQEPVSSSLKQNTVYAYPEGDDWFAFYVDEDGNKQHTVSLKNINRIDKLHSIDPNEKSQKATEVAQAATEVYRKQQWRGAYFKKLKEGNKRRKNYSPRNDAYQRAIRDAWMADLQGELRYEAIEVIQKESKLGANDWQDDPYLEPKVTNANIKRARFSHLPKYASIIELDDFELGDYDLTERRAARLRRAPTGEVKEVFDAVPDIVERCQADPRLILLFTKKTYITEATCREFDDLFGLLKGVFAPLDTLNNTLQANRRPLTINNANRQKLVRQLRQQINNVLQDPRLKLQLPYFIRPVLKQLDNELAQEIGYLREVASIAAEVNLPLMRDYTCRGAPAKQAKKADKKKGKENVEDDPNSDFGRILFDEEDSSSLSEDKEAEPLSVINDPSDDHSVASTDPNVLLQNAIASAFSKAHRPIPSRQELRDFAKLVTSTEATLKKVNDSVRLYLLHVHNIKIQDASGAQLTVSEIQAALTSDQKSHPKIYSALLVLSIIDQFRKYHGDEANRKNDALADIQDYEAVIIALHGVLERDTDEQHFWQNDRFRDGYVYDQNGHVVRDTLHDTFEEFLVRGLSDDVKPYTPQSDWQTNHGLAHALGKRPKPLFPEKELPKDPAETPGSVATFSPHLALELEQLEKDLYEEQQKAKSWFFRHSSVDDRNSVLTTTASAETVVGFDKYVYEAERKLAEQEDTQSLQEVYEGQVSIFKPRVIKEETDENGDLKRTISILTTAEGRKTVPERVALIAERKPFYWAYDKYPQRRKNAATYLMFVFNLHRLRLQAEKNCANATSIEALSAVKKQFKSDVKQLERQFKRDIRKFELDNRSEVFNVQQYKDYRNHYHELCANRVKTFTAITKIARTEKLVKFEEVKTAFWQDLLRDIGRHFEGINAQVTPQGVFIPYDKAVKFLEEQKKKQHKDIDPKDQQAVISHVEAMLKNCKTNRLKALLIIKVIDHCEGMMEEVGKCDSIKDLPTLVTLKNKSDAFFTKLKLLQAETGLPKETVVKVIKIQQAKLIEAINLRDGNIKLQHSIHQSFETYKEAIETCSIEDLPSQLPRVIQKLTDQYQTVISISQFTRRDAAIKKLEGDLKGQLAKLEKIAVGRVHQHWSEKIGAVEGESKLALIQEASEYINQLELPTRNKNTLLQALVVKNSNDYWAGAIGASATTEKLLEVYRHAFECINQLELPEGKRGALLAGLDKQYRIRNLVVASEEISAVDPKRLADAYSYFSSAIENVSPDKNQKKLVLADLESKFTGRIANVVATELGLLGKRRKGSNGHNLIESSVLQEDIDTKVREWVGDESATNKFCKAVRTAIFDAMLQDQDAMRRANRVVNLKSKLSDDELVNELVAFFYQFPVDPPERRKAIAALSANQKQGIEPRKSAATVDDGVSPSSVVDAEDEKLNFDPSPPEPPSLAQVKTTFWYNLVAQQLNDYSEKINRSDTPQKVLSAYEQAVKFLEAEKAKKNPGLNSKDQQAMIGEVKEMLESLRTNRLKTLLMPNVTEFCQKNMLLVAQCNSIKELPKLAELKAKAEAHFRNLELVQSASGLPRETVVKVIESQQTQLIEAINLRDGDIRLQLAIQTSLPTYKEAIETCSLEELPSEYASAVQKLTDQHQRVISIGQLTDGDATIKKLEGNLSKQVAGLKGHFIGRIAEEMATALKLSGEKFDSDSFELVEYDYLQDKIDTDIKALVGESAASPDFCNKVKTAIFHTIQQDQKAMERAIEIVDPEKKCSNDELVTELAAFFYKFPVEEVDRVAAISSALVVLPNQQQNPPLEAIVATVPVAGGQLQKKNPSPRISSDSGNENFDDDLDLSGDHGQGSPTPSTTASSEEEDSKDDAAKLPTSKNPYAIVNASRKQREIAIQNTETPGQKF